jgi:hypothetical protein
MQDAARALDVITTSLQNKIERARDAGVRSQGERGLEPVDEPDHLVIPLPPISSVQLTKATVTGAWTAATTDVSSGSRGNSLRAQTANEVAFNEKLGRQGEELVYRLERERVKAAGYSEDRVIWTASADPNADHDIQSVDDDGGVIWIEVKSTAGRSGKFSWSIAEFIKATNERRRYVLYRVYEAASEHASYMPFRDPIALYLEEGLRLAFDTLSGELPPLEMDD